MMGLFAITSLSKHFMITDVSDRSNWFLQGGRPHLVNWFDCLVDRLLVDQDFFSRAVAIFIFFPHCAQDTCLSRACLWTNPLEATGVAQSSLLQRDTEIVFGYVKIMVQH
jgi:hypothetical protein